MVSKILRNIGVELFREKSGYPKCDAQQNLMGRTHYVDDDTLRYHYSRILGRGVFADGALFYIITSDAMDMNNTQRGFRYVVFDVFGAVVSRLPVDQCFRTSDQARKALSTWRGTFDETEYYTGVLQQRAIRLQRELNALNQAIIDIETKEAA